MNLNNNSNKVHSSPNEDEVESPKKRMRIENAARKSWSLMDRKTDTEVLQEMGVSLLEPDDIEIYDSVTSNLHKPSAKRKRGIENVNPNVNSVTSPRGKFSPKSPKSKSGPSPGTSRGKSPRSTETAVPLQTAELVLETTVLSEYVVEEETPAGQSVSAEYCGYPRGPGSGAGGTTTGKKQPAHVATCVQEVVDCATKSGDGDAFANLPDELVLGVLRWLPKLTLSHCMLVCKRWYRLACDETLWPRLDLGNKTLAKDALGRILSRKPIIVRLASSEIGEWRPTGPVPPSRIQYLDLSMCSVDQTTLELLLESCPAIRKLSMENLKLSVKCQELIAKCSHMETLNLTMTHDVTAEGLTRILEGCTSLQSLNVSWSNLDEAALEVLASFLPQKLQRLNLSGTRILTNELVEVLVKRCPRLLELDLSDCARLGAPALQALRALTRLEHLALSRCYLLPPHALTKLSSMASLQYLEVWGMLQTSSLGALRAALPAIQVNQFMFRYFSVLVQSLDLQLEPDEHRFGDCEREIDYILRMKIFR